MARQTPFIDTSKRVVTAAPGPPKIAVLCKKRQEFELWAIGNRERAGDSIRVGETEQAFMVQNLRDLRQRNVSEIVRHGRYRELPNRFAVEKALEANFAANKK
jgi:hypothetical protein